MTGWVSHGVRITVRALAMFALWMLLVDNTHEPELVTGAVAAGVTAILGEFVFSASTEHVRFAPRMLRHAHRPFLLLVTDTARITRVLLTRLLSGRETPGRFRAVRYRAVTASDEDCGRRILTEWGA